MKLCSFVLCAIAFGVIASAPAKADFSVIRWNSGWCQIWDHAIPPGKPWTDDWKAVSGGHATIGEALAALDDAVKTKKCGW